MGVEDWDFLKRPCVLCGHPMGKHVIPESGTRQNDVGSKGMLCPPNAEKREEETVKVIDKGDV